MEGYRKCTFGIILAGVSYPLGLPDGDMIKKKAEYIGVDSDEYPYFGKKTGYIIGEGYKYEGEYKNGFSDFEDYEPSKLVKRKAIHFYKVLIAYNQIVWVKKEDAKIIGSENE